MDSVCERTCRRGDHLAAVLKRIKDTYEALKSYSRPDLYSILCSTLEHRQLDPKACLLLLTPAGSEQRGRETAERLREKETARDR